MIRAALIATPMLLVAGVASAQDSHAHHHPQPQQPPAKVADPHAGHTMPAPTADPHAGHIMPAPAADPHAGHTMPAPTADPHAGHTMPPPTADPHAGHTMPAPAADPHAGHVTPTPRVDPPVVGPSAAALSGPAHAADRYFDPADMAKSRAVIAHENGAMPTTALFIDKLEYSAGDGPDHGAWKVQGWTGGDINRLWLKTDGEFDLNDGVEAAGVELLYSRAVAPFWDVQAGLRQDYSRDSSDPTSLVLAVQGLAPYWWETSASVYMSTKGEVTAELEAEYDQRITQKLILQPVIGVSLSAQDIPERQIGSGLSSIEAGLRLRYEIRKEFAPYVGVDWSRAFGQTRDWREASGSDASETRFVVGIKAWL